MKLSASMLKDQKLTWGAIAIVVVLILGSFWYYGARRGDIPYSETDEGGNPTAPNSNDGNPSPTGSARKPAQTTPTKAPRLVNDVTAPSLTYTQAAAIFANSLIIFNEKCQMVPNPVSVQSGTTIMFDNRSRDARTFKLDGTSYTIPGYGFKLFQLKSTRLPHVVQVQCGQNNGEITLR